MACLFTVCALLYLHEEDDDGTEHEHGGPQRGQRARQDGHAHLLQHVTCPRQAVLGGGGVISFRQVHNVVHRQTHHQGQVDALEHLDTRNRRHA